jgi:hypothetical protein
MKLSAIAPIAQVPAAPVVARNPLPKAHAPAVPIAVAAKHALATKLVEVQRMK